MIRDVLRALLLALLPVQAAAGQESTHVVVLGDATAAPYEGLRAPWPERFHPFRTLPGPRVTSLAAPGTTAAEALRAFAAHEDAQDADWVVAQLGVEDAAAGVGPSELDVHLRALVRFVRAANEHAGILLLTPTPVRSSDRRWKDVARHAEVIRALAAVEGLPLVDLHRTFGRRDRFAGHAATDWLSDGIRPNDAGHGVIQHLVVRALQFPEPFVPGASHTARPADADPRRWQGRPDYSIPVVDVSGAADQQVVVDREDGQYLGHPTTVLLEDDRTMIAVYPKGHGKGAVVMKRSTDGGASWGERLPTPASWATSREVPTIHRVVDAAGTRRLVMFSGLHPIRMARSDDDGATWSELEPIGDYGGIVAMGCVVDTLTPGRYLALFHDDGRFLRGSGKPARTDDGWTRFHVYQVESTDGGLTWGDPRAITEPDWHHCEPGFVRSPDGSTLAVLLRENSRIANGHVTFSEDEGATWSATRPLPAALTGDRHVARYAPDGRLFITFRDRTLVSPTWGDWVGWVGTWEDLVEGREGQYRVRLMDNTKSADCAYPGLELLPDGTFVTTTYGHWTEGAAPYIVSVRFRMQDLDRRFADPSERR